MYTKGVLKMLDGCLTSATNIFSAFEFADKTDYKLLIWNGDIYAKNIDSEYRAVSNTNGWVKTCLTLNDFKE